MVSKKMNATPHTYEGNENCFLITAVTWGK